MLELLLGCFPHLVAGVFVGCGVMSFPHRVSADDVNLECPSSLVSTTAAPAAPDAVQISYEIGGRVEAAAVPELFDVALTTLFN